MPYFDYAGFGSDYFEGRTDPNGGHPAGYSTYEPDLLPFQHYSQYVHDELLASGVDPSGASVLVVGCAYGHTVQALRDLGIDAWGMDISTYAIQRSQEFASGYCMEGDVTVDADLRNARQTAGVGGKFDAIYLEAVLECLTDSEAQTAMDNVRKNAQYVVVRLWTTDGSGVDGTYYNAKSLAEWQTLLGDDLSTYWYHESEFQPGGV